MQTDLTSELNPNSFMFKKMGSKLRISLYFFGDDGIAKAKGRREEMYVCLQILF